MNTESALLGAYRQWRRLAEAEGKAICRRDWKFFSDCQQAIQSLQPSILSLSARVQDEWRQRGLNAAEKEDAFRNLARELVEIGRRNHAMLRLLLATAQTRIEQLGQTGRNLKRIRESYANPLRP